MSLLSNTCSLAVFEVQGSRPKKDFESWVVKGLNEGRFRGQEDSVQEQSIGFVQLDDSRRNEFDNSSLLFRAPYLCFSLRIDQRKVPRSLLKQRVLEEEEKWLRDHQDFNRLPRQVRQEVRDMAHNQLLAQTLPVPSVYEMAWNLEQDRLYVATVSPKVLEEIEKQFQQAFPGLILSQLHPYARADRVVPEKYRPGLHRQNKAGSDQVVDLIKDNQWLGADFFLWLSFVTARTSGKFTIAQEGPQQDGEAFYAYMDQRAVLRGEGKDGAQKLTLVGPQEGFEEVRTALQQGKQWTETALFFDKDEQIWRMTVKGESFQFLSVKTPRVQLEKDDTAEPEHEREAVFYEKMFLLESLFQMFDSLYAAFLSHRLGSAWSKKSKAILEWIEDAATKEPNATADESDSFE